ncbi:hypothetical protein N656DRAFT_785056 [Canariomyces notabilis]|uniref:Uncharacterized protein n=1 Tax=Canariomyces notabilis TaxID=2074819 RepID=A0AAN6QCM8_9PEZI|nr:hypothetical protein N656DRAFT_785056 [Canariomyces arenarius]
MGGGFPRIVPRKVVGRYCSLSTNRQRVHSVTVTKKRCSTCLLMRRCGGGSEPASAVSSFRDLLRDESDWAESWDGGNGNRHGREGGT